MRETSYDEGMGCGFDQLSPDAYAERWVEVTDGAGQVLPWFVEQLGRLGWSPVGPVPTSGNASCRFVRDSDERMGVLIQGLGEWWKDADRLVNWLGGANTLRVHLAIDGVFPDGRTGGRAG